MPGGHQPVSRLAGRPNLNALCRSFRRRRNVNRPVPYCVRELRQNRVCHFICRSVAAECVTASKVSRRYESAATSQPTSGETIGCPSRASMAAITRLRVWDRPVHTPRYRSLSVIDERHFCNDSPTCDFSILEGRGRAR